MTGLVQTGLESKIAKRPGRRDNGLKMIMHHQHAVCLEVEETESKCAGAGFVLLRIATPMPDINMMAAPGRGSAIPILWLPETSWPTAIQNLLNRRSSAPRQRFAA